MSFPCIQNRLCADRFTATERDPPAQNGGSNRTLVPDLGEAAALHAVHQVRRSLLIVLALVAAPGQVLPQAVAGSPSTQHPVEVGVPSSDQRVQSESAYNEMIELLEGGKDAPRLASTLNNLGVLYLRQTRFAEAERVLERALAIHATTVQPDAVRAVYLNNLGEVYRHTGRWQQAEATYQRALRIPGNGPYFEAAALGNLGLVYASQNKHGRAESFLTKAIAILEKQIPLDHEKLIRVFNNLASVRASLGRPGEARELYERSLSIAGRHLDRQHSSTAPILNNLANLYIDAGDYSQAEQLYREALDISTRVFGPEHATVATALGNLANICFKLGRYVESEQFYRRALPILTRVYGRNHPLTLRRSQDFAVLLRKVGRKRDAAAIEKAARAFLQTRAHEDFGAESVDIKDLQRERSKTKRPN